MYQFEIVEEGFTKSNKETSLKKVYLTIATSFKNIMEDLNKAYNFNTIKNNKFTMLNNLKSICNKVQEFELYVIENLYNVSVINNASEECKDLILNSISKNNKYFKMTYQRKDEIGDSKKIMDSFIIGYFNALEIRLQQMAMMAKDIEKL